MGSHRDIDHEMRRDFLRELELRSEIMTDLGKNRLQNERVLVEWKGHDVNCHLLPDDRQGILRISIGGGKDVPVSGDYCNIRGDVGKCIELMERSIKALKAFPE